MLDNIIKMCCNFTCIDIFESTFKLYKWKYYVPDYIYTPYLDGEHELSTLGQMFKLA